jgi:hypothetical protein
MITRTCPKCNEKYRCNPYRVDGTTCMGRNSVISCECLSCYLKRINKIDEYVIKLLKDCTRGIPKEEKLMLILML